MDNKEEDKALKILRDKISEVTCTQEMEGMKEFGKFPMIFAELNEDLLKICKELNKEEDVSVRIFGILILVEDMKRKVNDVLNKVEELAKPEIETPEKLEEPEKNIFCIGLVNGINLTIKNIRSEIEERQKNHLNKYLKPMKIKITEKV